VDIPTKPKFKFQKWIEQGAELASHLEKGSKRLKTAVNANLSERLARLV
jgi:hypothetical protein